MRSLETRLARLEKGLQESDAVLDVILSDASFQPSTSSGMNGQVLRKQLVEAVSRSLGIELAIETGTFFGFTTGYLRTTLNVPVLTCEVRPRYHHVARRLLRSLSDVSLQLQDSRGFLRQLAVDERLRAKTTLFYLDAHWYQDLPLTDELEIIVQNWKRFVAIIDDFQVPGDEGYGYDDYGESGVLTQSLIEPLADTHRLSIFYPRAKSTEETGSRRGCCVVLPRIMVQELRECELLRDSGLPARGPIADRKCQETA